MGAYCPRRCRVVEPTSKGKGEKRGGESGRGGKTRGMGGLLVFGLFLVLASHLITFQPIVSIHAIHLRGIK